MSEMSATENGVHFKVKSISNTKITISREQILNSSCKRVKKAKFNLSDSAVCRSEFCQSTMAAFQQQNLQRDIFPKTDEKPIGMCTSQVCPGNIQIKSEPVSDGYDSDAHSVGTQTYNNNHIKSEFYPDANMYTSEPTPKKQKSAGELTWSKLPGHDALYSETIKIDNTFPAPFGFYVDTLDDITSEKASIKVEPCTDEEDSFAEVLPKSTDTKPVPLMPLVDTDVILQQRTPATSIVTNKKARSLKNKSCRRPSKSKPKMNSNPLVVPSESPRIKNIKTEFPTIKIVKSESLTIKSVKGESPAIKSVKSESPPIKSVKSESPPIKSIKSEPVTDWDGELATADEFVVEIDIADEMLDFTTDNLGEKIHKDVAQEVSEEDLPLQFGKPVNKRKSKPPVKAQQPEELSVCGTCGMEFGTAEECINHIQDQHGIKNMHLCTICGQVFPEASQLATHEETEHCHKNGDNESRYKCPKCSQSFAHVAGLKCHIRMHDDNKVYKCDGCDKVFTHIHTLTIHRRTHTMSKEFKCEVKGCDASFYRIEYLRHHVLKHTGERPFPCDQCHKTFTNRSNLTAHMRTHSGEKPYKCSHCLAAFTTSSALTVHKWRHTEDKPFKCEHCSATFSTAHTYKRHQVKHTGQRDFVCADCGKAFTQPSSLTIHRRSHTGERPFFCTLCGATFAQSAHLTVHVRKHTGERPFPCKQCDKSFPRSEYLLKHRRRFHKEVI